MLSAPRYVKPLLRRVAESPGLLLDTPDRGIAVMGRQPLVLQVTAQCSLPPAHCSMTFPSKTKTIKVAYWLAGLGNLYHHVVWANKILQRSYNVSTMVLQ